MTTLISTEQLAETRLLAPTDIELMRESGTGPAYIRLPSGEVRYEEECVRAWLDSLREYSDLEIDAIKNGAGLAATQTARDDDLLTTAQVAEMLNLSIYTIGEALRDGSLRGYHRKKHGRWLIGRADAISWARGEKPGAAGRG